MFLTFKQIQLVTWSAVGKDVQANTTIKVGNTDKERGKLMMVRGASKARRDYMEMLVVF